MQYAPCGGSCSGTYDVNAFNYGTCNVNDDSGCRWLNGLSSCGSSCESWEVQTGSSPPCAKYCCTIQQRKTCWRDDYPAPGQGMWVRLASMCPKWKCNGQDCNSFAWSSVTCSNTASWERIEPNCGIRRRTVQCMTGSTAIPEVHCTGSKPVETFGCSVCTCSSPDAPSGV